MKIEDLKKHHPILELVSKKQPVYWENKEYKPRLDISMSGMKVEFIKEAHKRLERFKPVFFKLFPEVRDGIVSPIVEIPKMKQALSNLYETKINGSLLLKRDDVLPVAGSIKARGGFHEVIAFAESLAYEHGLLTEKQNDYQMLLSETARKLFQQYTISVGSTGNLGLSIGLIGSALGFRVAVHMSIDAKEWKKSLLRKHGVNVVEHSSDYSTAVEIARKESERDDYSYFIDDEQSQLLFAGYAVAALEVQKQLCQLNIDIGPERPLYVYLPCGVGGGPGGVAFGLKAIFKENVHCIFAEPTASPCMLICLVTKLHHKISVQDFGLDNQTEADGLAVGRASSFVGKLMEEVLSGSYTVPDEELLGLLYVLSEAEGAFLEPSALAGMKGPVFQSKKKQGEQSVHLVWATGGSLVPDQMKASFIERGKESINKFY